MSPSISEDEPGAQVRVLPSTGEPGDRLTDERTGAVLSMVRFAPTGVPDVAPSFGVTVHVTVSPPTKPVDKVTPVPNVELPRVQATVDWSVSPSASLNVQLQRSVLDAVAGSGLIKTLETVGTLFAMVTALLTTAAPESSPSSGVTVQVIVSPFEKKPDARVLVVAPLTTLPATVQA